MTPDQLAEVIKLRDMGVEWKEIGRIVGKHFSTCSNAYYKAKGDMAVPVVRVHT